MSDDTSQAGQTNEREISQGIRVHCIKAAVEICYDQEWDMVTREMNTRNVSESFYRWATTGEW